MKKFGKFLFTTVSLAALAGGAVYFVKNVLNKESNDDFDDFDDDFDDFDLDDEEDEIDEDINSNREYVTININDSTKEEEPCEKESTPEMASTSSEN